MTIKERLDIYEKLMRLDKPIGILLLLWPTLWGLWLSAVGTPNPWIAAIFVLGVVLMRSLRPDDLEADQVRCGESAAGSLKSSHGNVLALRDIPPVPNPLYLPCR